MQRKLPGRTDKGHARRAANLLSIASEHSYPREQTFAVHSCIQCESELKPYFYHISTPFARLSLTDRAEAST
jgi:hypothetical protein